jgi:transcriptional regulator with XRE-family HTH domain
MYIQPSLRLAQLRKEKNIPQKTAAKDLGISQALLSHYERGIRECGLAFIVKASDYYGVTCDYLLGCSMEKSNTCAAIDAEDTTASRTLKGSISAAIARRLLNNSLNILFDIIEKCNNQELSKHCMDIFALQIYKLYYYMYSAAGQPDGYLTLPKAQFPYRVDACLTLCEMTVKNIISDEKWVGSALATVDAETLPPIDHDALEKAYPALASSLFNVLHNAQLTIDKSH